MSDSGVPEQPADTPRPVDATQPMARTGAQEPSGPAGPGGAGRGSGPPPGGGRGGAGGGSGDPSFWDSVPAWAAAIAGAAVVLLAVVVFALFAGNDDDGDDVATDATPAATETPEVTPTTSADPTAEPTADPTAEPDPTPTAVATPTPEPTATPATEPTATPESPPVDPAAYASAVWPWVDSDVRYNEPTAAALGFATDFIGFTDPVVGEFLQGDSRSGEVEVRPRADGPVTTVFVRQLGPDDTWWVLGSATANISIDEPDALAEVTSPLQLRGSALAFEGTVDVEIRADGSDEPVFTGFVTGGGTEMAPFDDTLDWDSPGAGSGALVLKTLSAEDGRVWEAAVVRVAFG